MRLGEVIRKYRIEHELSMAEFAKISGISKQYVSVLERGTHPTSGKEIAPSLEVIKKSAKAMGMSFDDLFDMLDGEVTLNASEESNTPIEEPFNASFLEKNKSQSAFEEMRIAYARNRHGLTREQRMKLAAEILNDEEQNID